MKELFRSGFYLAIIITALAIIVFLATVFKIISGIDILKINENVANFNLLIAPICTIVTVGFLWPAYKQQVRGNDIQMKVLNHDVKNTEYQKSITYLEEVKKFKSYLLFVDNTGISYTEHKAIDKYGDYLFYKNHENKSEIPVSLKVIKNIGEFYQTLQDYLEVVEMSAKHICEFYSHNDSSFFIIRKNFQKEIDYLKVYLIVIGFMSIDETDAEHFYYEPLRIQTEKTHLSILLLNKLGNETT